MCSDGVYLEKETYEKSELPEVLKAHCRGCDWLVVMLKSKTKLWPLSNYQAFMLLDHALFREQREPDHYDPCEFQCTAKLLNFAKFFSS